MIAIVRRVGCYAYVYMCVFVCVCVCYVFSVGPIDGDDFQYAIRTEIIPESLDTCAYREDNTCSPTN